MEKKSKPHLDHPAPPPEQVTIRAAGDSREATVIRTDGEVLAVLFGDQSHRDQWRDHVLSAIPGGVVVEVSERVGARGLWPIVKGATS